MTRKRWQDAYAIGDQVESLLQMAHGVVWKDCVVTRKTASGYPVVEPIGIEGYALVVERKGDIRPSKRGAA